MRLPSGSSHLSLRSIVPASLMHLILFPFLIIQPFQISGINDCILQYGYSDRERLHMNSKWGDEGTCSVVLDDTVKEVL